VDRDRSEPSWSVARDPALLIVLLLVTFLAIAVLSLDVTRTTYGIKGDEATYVAMALSVAHDGDLAFQQRDLTRFYRVYQRGPEGIFLKRGQGAAAHDNRLYFGKAFIYPVLAAPFVRVAGLNGLLFLQVVLLTGVFVCAYAFAAERLPRTGALLVATGFLAASSAPLYAVWLTSDFFNLALVFYAYFFWLYKEAVTKPLRLPRMLTGSASDIIAAVLLGLVTFSKVSNLPLILPLIGLAWWRRRFGHGALIFVAWGAIVLGCFGANAAISGEWNYQGGDERKTFYGQFPFEHGPADFDSLGTSVSTNELILDETNSSFARELGRNAVYFIIGRHFGLLPYFFPGIVIFVWALWHPRRLVAWQVLIAGAVVATALGLLALLPNTWSGGGGPVGNRYFLSIYPALFFLLPTARSITPGVLIWIGGALFTAQILVDPFVTASRPWLLSQQGLFRLLPVELTMVNDLPVRLDQERSRIPYGENPQLLLYYLDDNAARPEPPGIWVSGRARADIIVRVNPPLTALQVTLQTPVKNRAHVEVDGSTQVAELQPNVPVQLHFPVRGVHARGAQNFVLTVETHDGFVPRLLDPTSTDPRFLGVAVDLSGTARATAR